MVMNDRRLLTLPSNVIVHPVNDKLNDIEIIITLAEMIQRHASVAQFLLDDYNEDNENKLKKWQGVERGRGNQVLGIKSNYVRSRGATDAFYQFFLQVK